MDGLVQERRNSIANALGLRLSCTKPSISSWPVLTLCTKQIWNSDNIWSMLSSGEIDNTAINQHTLSDIHIILFCFNGVILMDSFSLLSHNLQGCFTGAGAIVNKNFQLDIMDKIHHNQTTTRYKPCEWSLGCAIYYNDACFSLSIFMTVIRAALNAKIPSTAKKLRNHQDCEAV